MKLIRYTLNNAPEDIRFGVLKDKEIFSIEGDVFSGKFQIGSLASTLDAVTLKAPCLPSKVVGIAINFEGIDNFSAEMAEPMVFVKPASCVCGPYSEVKNPFPELKWWGEAELAVVIGKMVKNITEEDASDAVFGFTIANDTPMSASTDSNVGLQFNVKYGAAKLDTVAVQYVADAEYNNAFPTDPT